MLDNYARLTWPDDYKDLLYFHEKWRIRLAQNAARIQTVDHLRKELKTVDCILDYSSLSKWGELLVQIIRSTLESVPPSAVEEREIKESLLKLKLFEYFARYGDYFAYQSSRIQKVAEEMKVEGWEILKGYWTGIAKDIQEEMALAKLNGNKLVYPSASKRAAMLVATAKSMGVASDSLITSIMAYGEQNSPVHSSIDEFLQKKQYSAVAKLLWQDEKDLPLLMPPERSEEKEALLQIIVALREDIFDIEPGEEDNYQLESQ